MNTLPQNYMTMCDKPYIDTQVLCYGSIFVLYSYLIDWYTDPCFQYFNWPHFSLQLQFMSSSYICFIYIICVIILTPFDTLLTIDNLCMMAWSILLLSIAYLTWTQTLFLNLFCFVKLYFLKDFSTLGIQPLIVTNWSGSNHQCT